MKKKYKKFLSTQIVISFAVLGSFFYFFLISGTLTDEEEMAAQAIQPAARFFKPQPDQKQFQLSDENTPLQVAVEALNGVNIKSILPQHHYEWVVGLGNKERSELFKYLKPLPVQTWEKELKTLQEVPREALYTHLRHRTEEKECHGDGCY